MNIKLVTRIFKEIIDEVFRPNKRKRGIVRSSRYFSNLSFLELRKALKEDKIDLIVDVGANSGQFYSLCRKELKYSGKVFSFEPNPVMVQILQDSQKNDPDWEVFPFALGAAEGTLSFNVYQDSKLSSFLNGTDKNLEGFRDKFRFDKSVQVIVKTLDSFFEERGGIRGVSSVFLKLDTQGFDLEVLKGLNKYKHLVKYIQSEISVIPIYENMPHYTESINCFESEGYRLISLVPVTREKETGFVIEFDALWGRHI